MRSHRDCILQRTDLARAYSDCVQLVHSVSEAYFAKQYQTSVAQAAVEAVASLARLSTEMTTRLATDSFFGYQACVAHFREVALVLVMSDFVISDVGNVISDAFLLALG